MFWNDKPPSRWYTRMSGKRGLLLLLLLPLLGRAAAPPPTVTVELRGVEQPLLGNIRGLLSLEQRRHEANLNEQRIRRLHAQAEREIRTALQPFGYYSPEIEGELIPPPESGMGWIARYQIEPGEPVYIERISIEVVGPGREEASWPALLAAQPLRERSVLHHLAYEQTKRNLFSHATSIGYLNARYRHSQIQVNPAQGVANIELVLDTGPLFRFGEALIEQSLFGESFMRRHLTYTPGDPLTDQALAQLRRTLSATGYFSRIILDTDLQQADADHHVPLEIQLTPAKPNQYRARLGYGTDTGIGLRADWRRRYLTEYGHHFNLGAIATQEKNTLITDLRYQIPLNPANRTFLELGLRHRGKDLGYDDIGLRQGDETRITSYATEGGLHRPRQLWGLELEERISLGYLSDRYSIFDLLFGHQPPEVRSYIADLLGPQALATLNPTFNALIPGIGWSYRRSDDPIFPTDGEYLNLQLRGALDGFASNLTFFQTDLRGVLTRPLFGRDRIITRGHLAYTQVSTEAVLGIEFNQMPESYEYRTGGDSSVRGYAYESLVSGSAITGGKHLLVGSIEYEKRLLEEWSIAAFYDLGNAFNDFSDPNLKAGAGVGARWYSPVGLVRLDLAFALDDPGTPWRIHFRIGPEF